MSDIKRPVTIGLATLIDLPKSGINSVPAKIDTGADSSSIWASKIKEVDGKLTFALFDISSPFFTGETITTRDYQVRLIKNSFGHTEFRFTAKIWVLIEGKKIKIRFTLADRSANSFPILIGRRTLQKRFVVDVSKDGIKKKRNVLVLNSKNAKTITKSKKFLKNIETGSNKVHFAFASYDDLIFVVDGNDTRVSLLTAESDIAKFDLVYFRTVLANRDVVAAAAKYLKYRGTTFMDKASIHYQKSLNKLQQAMTLSSSRVSVPKTVYMSPTRMPKYFDLVEKNLGLPFVLKDIHGKHSKYIYLINSKSEFDLALKKAKKRGIELLAQQFIPHDGHFRLLILGNRLELVIQRVHKLAESRLSDPDYKEQPRLISEKTLPGKVRRMAIRAAENLSVDIAGVDIVQDKINGSWYCLEVNDGPQITTGAYQDEKRDAFSRYLSKQLQSKL